jgi:hypothetical protein
LKDGFSFWQQKVMDKIHFFTTYMKSLAIYTILRSCVFYQKSTQISAEVVTLPIGVVMGLRSKWAIAFLSNRKWSKIKGGNLFRLNQWSESKSI